MKPILRNGIEGFITEPDPQVAEQAVVANLKLIEGVVATYPDDVELLNMAAMARANYAFGFLVDRLEALRLAHPDKTVEAQRLKRRIRLSYAAGRHHAETALAENSSWMKAVSGQALELMSPEAFTAAVATLDKSDAEAAFWLAFSWGGAMQADLDPVAATQLPKVEQLVARVLELDDTVFFNIGPDMLSGVLYGFRAPALGGNPEAAERHLKKAAERGDILLPRVLLAQFVYAQNEKEEEFTATLNAVIKATPREDRALLDVLAQMKACRLLANLDAFFLSDAKAVPESCHVLPHPYRLRAEPLEEEEEEDTPADVPSSLPASTPSAKSTPDSKAITSAPKSSPDSKAITSAPKSTPNFEAITSAPKSTPNFEATHLGAKSTPDSEANAHGAKSTPNFEAITSAPKSTPNFEAIAHGAKFTPDSGAGS